MTVEVFKHTKSLSPLTLKPIDAEIIFDGENVCMVKKDEEGKEYKALVEKDKELYLLFTRLTDESAAETQFVSAYVSSKCNLNCQVCYERCGSDKEVSLEELKGLSEKYKNCRIGLTGMEPTCREDIFELIKVVKNNHSLVTNGIKLESLEYVRKLKKHGLKRLCFSFNGFNDEIYRKMNGGNLLETKLKALKNVEFEKLDTLLSVTVARNINEDQILPLVEFCFKNRSFIIGLRIRTLAPIGKHLNTEQICMSELIDLMANSLQISKTDIVTEFCFMQAFIERFSKILPKGLKDHYGTKLCSFMFNVRKKKDGGYSCPGSRIDLNRINKSVFRSFYMLYYLFKAYGFSILMETFLHIRNLHRFVVQRKMLNITLRCWPTLYNIDLEEMNKCPHLYYKNGEMEKLCISNIKNSDKKKEK
ncbi:MAG: radical SAM protein [Syntrophaceae bacterium]|nr:radical SAM protein [Syntrophaceae bacterium]